MGKDTKEELSPNQKEMRGIADLIIKTYKNSKAIPWAEMLVLTKAYSNTSDFQDSEIRVLNCSKSLKDFHEWDCILPIVEKNWSGDIGIDKDKNQYLYDGDKWIKWE